ncbi:MAG: HD-GYP domain-containing protein [Clostridium sp.]|nr:HD-GYP domain-containing protein [Clostridium sp.]
MYYCETMPIDQVTPGMIIGKSVEDRLGRHLVERGMTLNAYIIQHLKEYGFEELTIQVHEEPDKKAETIAPSIRNTIKLLREPDQAKVTFQENFRARVSKGIQYIYAGPTEHELAHAATVMSEDLLRAIEKNNAIAINISELQTSDEYTFKHSVDVATISMVIARRRGWKRHQIIEVGEAGLLHDIGKTKIPNELLNKAERLTDEEFQILKGHSLLGYELVKDNREVSPAIALGILQHHEKIDGSGYPFGATVSQIHPYAKVIAVADIYDALVTERPYKKGYSNKDAIAILMSMTDKLDMDTLQAFLSAIILYPVDSQVMLSNGEVAQVVRNNPNLSLRPVVVGLASGNVYDLSSRECSNLVIMT